MNQPVAVLGATGGQGGAVVRALLAEGVPVRAVVRSPRSARARAPQERGVEVVPGDLEDTDSLTPAFTGVRAAFAVTTPFEEGVEAEVRQGRSIVSAAVAAEVPHLVFSSVAGADRDSGVPHFQSKHLTETMIGETRLPWTVVAPTYFFDNIRGSGEDLMNGVLPLPLEPEQPFQQVARPDLGAFVAHAIGNPEPHLGARIELAGDDPTPTRMTQVLAHVLGRPVRPVTVPVSDVYAYSADMGAMWEFIGGGGYQVDIPALKASYPSVPWTSFAPWIEEAFTQS
ncbi:NmrA/HSCARG family protein [Streptomyces sp. NPDC018026]|uniref:NmrA/HSCARG family protein n=1 Tax=Streptomyces sp. NPDC018026 TaxID=3365031 RepID=UPI0037BCAB51